MNDIETYLEQLNISLTEETRNNLLSTEFYFFNNYLKILDFNIESFIT